VRFNKKRMTDSSETDTKQNNNKGMREEILSSQVCVFYDVFFMTRTQPFSSLFVVEE